MKHGIVSAGAGQRLGVRIACAGVVLALCTACGPGGPKVDTDNDDAGSSGGISLLAGNAGTAGTLDAKGALARFNTPRGIARDSSGNLYVADELNYVIRKIATDGTVTTFAGTAGYIASDDGVGSGAHFTDPTALTIDASNNLYVTDGMAIRKITPSAVVTTLTTLNQGSNNAASTLPKLQPSGIAIDTSGNLFITTGVGTRRISSSLVTQNLEGDLLQNNQIGTYTLTPRGVTVGSDGTAYVADLKSAIKRIASGSTTLADFAGTDGQTGSTNDTGTNARFEQVVALTTDTSGNVYAADAGANNVIRKVTPNLNLTTVAGAIGNSSLATGGLPGSLATIRGITSDGTGTLYVTSGNAVVKIVLP